MNPRRSIHRTLVLLVVALILAACDTTPRNRGVPKSYRLESRLPSEGPRLGSANLTVATEQMVSSIANVPQVEANQGRTVIVLDRIANRTSDPTAQFQIYLARIRALLNQSGAQRDLVFVADRGRAAEIKSREGIPPGDTSRTRPEYALTGTFYDMPRGLTNYHLLTFQLIDLGNDRIIWEDSYEVKL